MMTAWVVLKATTPSLPWVVSVFVYHVLMHSSGYGTFFALSESSLASMVMYFTPLTLTPSEMTFLGSDLSLKDLAMAALSSADSYSSSAPSHSVCATGASHRRRSLCSARILSDDVPRSRRMRPR